MSDAQLPKGGAHHAPSAPMAQPERDPDVASGARVHPSESVAAALRSRHPAPEWAIFFEVPSATGGAAARRADAIAMSLWPSRGLEIHGFEIKVDRRDWLRELKDPAKAEEIARFCDRWWLAVTPGVVKEGELPAGWGLLVLHGETLRQEREAPRRDEGQFTRAFVASLLRRAQEASPQEAMVRAAVERAITEERKRTAKHDKGNQSRAERELERLQTAVSDFEAASGVAINGWRGGKDIGAAVRFVLDGGLKLKRSRIAALSEQLQQIQDGFKAALAIDMGDEPAGGDQ